MSIRKLPNGRWEARIRVEGRHLKKTFTRKTDATAWESKVRHDRDRGIHVDMSDQTTVADYYAAWLEARVLRFNSRKSYATMLNIHLRPVPLGSRPIVRVRPSEIQAWADAADTRIKAMITVQAALGLRIGELKALRTQDVDFLRREVHITEQIDAHSGRRAPLKTVNSPRVVPLPEIAAVAISEHIRVYPPGPDGLIFTQARVTVRSDGHRYSARSSQRTVLAPAVWNKRRVHELYGAAAEAAGLPAGTSSHDLRHHYASVLLAAGESVHAVAERLGDRPEMVLRIYGHVLPNQEDRTRKAVDAAWQAASDSAEEVL